MKKRNHFLVVLLLLLSFSCTPPQNDLIGTWKNDQGKTLVFNKDHSALWLFPSDEKPDTFHILYKVNYDVMPIQLDLYDFESGPLAGVTLYGIVEIEADSFRCDFEPGDTSTVRPVEFDEKQTQTYVRQ